MTPTYPNIARLGLRTFNPANVNMNAEDFTRWVSADDLASLRAACEG